MAPLRILKFKTSVDSQITKMDRPITIQSMPKMSEASSSSSGQSNCTEVRVIKSGESQAAAECLAKAFATDDVSMYFIETDDTKKWSEKKKWDRHLGIMKCLVDAHCIKGLVTTVGPNYGCVALWMPPGKNMDDRLTMLRSGMYWLDFKLSKEGRKRFSQEFMPLLHRTKYETLGEIDNDSWYLVYIGTKPEARGRGYARKLIEHVTKQADDEGRVCYLESSNDVNPVIYRKLGFEIVKKITLIRGPQPVELDIMVRQPIPNRNFCEPKLIKHSDQPAGTT